MLLLIGGIGPIPSIPSIPKGNGRIVHKLGTYIPYLGRYGPSTYLHTYLYVDYQFVTVYCDTARSNNPLVL